MDRTDASAPTPTPSAADCWRLWLQDLEQPPLATCVHLTDQRDPRRPLLGILDMSRPRSLCCTDCAKMWSNWVMPNRCGCCGSAVPADELTTVVREMGWGANGTLLCTARLCSLCLLLMPGPLARVYVDELGEMSWSTTGDDD